MKPSEDRETSITAQNLNTSDAVAACSEVTGEGSEASLAAGLPGDGKGAQEWLYLIHQAFGPRGKMANVRPDNKAATGARPCLRRAGEEGHALPPPAMGRPAFKLSGSQEERTVCQSRNTGLRPSGGDSYGWASQGNNPGGSCDQEVRNHPECSPEGTGLAWGILRVRGYRAAREARTSFWSLF